MYYFYIFIYIYIKNNIYNLGEVTCDTCDVMLLNVIDWCFVNVRQDNTIGFGLSVGLPSWHPRLNRLRPCLLGFQWQFGRYVPGSRQHKIMMLDIFHSWSVPYSTVPIWPLPAVRHMLFVCSFRDWLSRPGVLNTHFWWLNKPIFVTCCWLHHYVHLCWSPFAIRQPLFLSLPMIVAIETIILHTPLCRHVQYPF